MRIDFIIIGLFLSHLVVNLFPVTGSAQETLPIYLRDRGPGVSSSMFGTYIQRGELIIYPFYEYYYDNDVEYEPADFGFASTQELRGRYRAHEFLLFFGYGIGEWLVVEVEAAVIDAKFYKSPDDPSNLPEKLEESGMGDVESQIHWRWFGENMSRPELFSYFETVFPLQ